MSQEYDDFDEALLRAGRRAPAPPRLRERALGAAAAGAAALATTKAAAGVAGAKASGGILGKVAIKWALVAAVGATSVGAAYVVETRLASPEAADPAPPAVVTAASPVTKVAPPVVTAAPSVAPPPPEDPPEPPPAAPVARSRPSTAEALPVAPPPERESALREEIALVDAARAAIADGDPAFALRRIEDHAARFPAGSFAVERDVLRIDALVLAGRSDEARERARAFVARHPKAAQARRIEKIAGADPNP
jgi:hypothetical protein